MVLGNGDTTTAWGGGLPRRSGRWPCERRWWLVCGLERCSHVGAIGG